MGSAETFDFLVVGAGIAGLRAAIELAQAGRVLVLTKQELGESNTQYAQGGIAVALGGEQDVALHLKDTINAGDGLVDVAAARLLVEEGPALAEELLSWGTRFDRKDGQLLLTREGAHSRSRILHANGDATGKEIGRSLLEHARGLPEIEFREHAITVDLLEEDQEVSGVSVLRADGEIVYLTARAVLLASGGAGQVFSDTTNPAVATGDGIAMAYRAGAEVADMEFYQFHPTVFSLPGAPRFLLSEALRGEGAYLRNAKLERFMERYHPLMELAPRDVVARAITQEGFAAAGEQTLPVYLDMRHIEGVDLHARFPGISAFLKQYGLELGRDLIPVRPAAHYLMGGIWTDVDGRSSLRRLYAAGEAACTGVHGANRLASNSLLEGLVFGARAARAMLAETGIPNPGAKNRRPGAERAILSPAGVNELRDRLRTSMWRNAGLLRDAEGLKAAARELDAMEADLPSAMGRSAIELRNLHTVAQQIVQSAGGRWESRGAHFRRDFPTRDDRNFQKHSVLRKGELRFEDFSAASPAPISRETASAGKRPL